MHSKPVLILFPLPAVPSYFRLNVVIERGEADYGQANVTIGVLA